MSSRRSTTWEGGVRVPFFARWKGKITPGTVINGQVGAITDLLPTLVGLAGGSLPAGRTLDGIDLWPVWSGQSPPVSRSFAHFRSGNIEAIGLSRIFRRLAWHAAGQRILTGGLGTAAMDFAIYGAFKGHQAFANGAAGVLDDFNVKTVLAPGPIDPAPSLPFINSAVVFSGGTRLKGGISTTLDAYSTGNASFLFWFKPDVLPTTTPQVLWETGGSFSNSTFPATANLTSSSNPAITSRTGKPSSIPISRSFPSLPPMRRGHSTMTARTRIPKRSSGRA